MTFICEHWEALASLLLSVVAIIIAIWASRKTSKEATRQIESIKELSHQTIDNTSKEVESIKELAKLQIDTIRIEIEMEVSKQSIQMQRADEEWNKLSGINTINQRDFKIMAINDFETEKPLRDLKYIRLYLSELRKNAERIEEIRTKLK